MDPCSAWTAKANKRVQFGYGLNYLIDIEYALAIDPVHHNEIDGRGYKLWFIGGMRDAIMMGRREATLDLQKIQIPFETHERDAALIGFWSDKHNGIFTPMGSNVHIHFQTSNNDASGHVQGLDLGQAGMTLRLPQG